MACALCHNAEYRYTECHCAECRNTECHCAEFHSIERHYAECRYTECHCAESRGADLVCVWPSQTLHNIPRFIKRLLSLTYKSDTNLGHAE